jgi:serine/threonine protein kinase
MHCICRFKVREGRKVHESDSCLVMIVDDTKLKQKVALKLMSDEEQWQREIRQRQTADGAALEESHVIPILDSLVDQRAQSFSRAFPFILVMPAAEKDMGDFLSHSTIAGSNWESIATIMQQVAEHLQYLHVTCNTIHADIKPRNIVQINAEGSVKYVLIDLDAACKRGTLAGQKVTSSARFPPELARLKLDKMNSRAYSETVVATEQLDTW